MKEEPGPAAPALPPITDPNVLALIIQQMQIQNQSPIAAIMAQQSVSPVIHKPALPPIRTGPAGEVDLQMFEMHILPTRCQERDGLQNSVLSYEMIF